MAKQINPSLARLWQSHDQRRYGSERAIVVRVCSEAENRALDLLETGLTNDQFLNLEKLARIHKGSLENLLDQLGPILTSTTSFIPAISPKEVEQRFTEILRLFANGDGDPAITMQNRKLAKVFVSTLSRPGLVAAKSLLNLGVGKLLTFDSTRVKAKDTSELGYRNSQIGLTRYQALHALVDRSKTALELHTRMTPSLATVDCALLIQTDVILPDSYQPWITRDTAHLAVTFTETGARVSQLVIPGVTPCLACNEIQRMTEDASWLATATQLTGYDRDFGDTTTLLTALGIALNRIVRYLDSGIESLGSNTELMISSETHRIIEVPATTANCGCRTTSDIPTAGDPK